MSAPCPICGKPAQQEYRPFCSKRCADVDLQRWLSGRYEHPLELRLLQRLFAYRRPETTGF